MNKKIHLSLARMSGKEKFYINDAFDSNWVTPMGPNVNGFEKDLKAYFNNTKHVVSLNSGTAAIHLGLILLGVKGGDEVICQSFTFVASANPILYLGALPIFVDSEKESWNISPELLRESIEDRISKTGKKPKAIIIVHLYGMPAKMDEIIAISKDYEIPVLEDAAEALGSEYKGQKCGTFTNHACLSFNGNKIITTSGGGALVCTDKDDANKTVFLSTQARDDYPWFEHSMVGYNYRMSNISAGIGRGQMTILEENILLRRNIHKIYSQLLQDIPGVSVLENPSSDFDSNFWLTCITVEPVLTGFTIHDLFEKFNDENIECRRLWKPLHLQPLHKHVPFYGDGTSKDIFKKGLCLPSGTNLTKKDIIRVVDVIKSISIKYKIYLENDKNSPLPFKKIC